MYWIVLLTSACLLAVCALIYFLINFHRFSFVAKLGEKRKLLSWGIAAIPVLIMILFVFLRPAAAIIAILHLFVIWFLCNRIAGLVRLVSHKKWVKNWPGICALAITFLYLCYGWYAAHHVIETDYRVMAEKDLGMEKLRIAAIADAHLGTTFDGAGFAEHLKKVQDTNPDLLVILGDFVDDDTKKTDMVTACQALGSMRTTYGVYFVFGNHDKGYYNNRDFSADDLKAELAAHNVRVLEDETVILDDLITLVGRQDKHTPNRADMETLMEQIPDGHYSIVFDHQPADYDAQAKAGADLVLSGHTHGGWMFPMTILSNYFGLDDQVYGMRRIDRTDFIVTSGISDWALPFKPGTYAEFLIVDVVRQD